MRTSRFAETSRDARSAEKSSLPDITNTGALISSPAIAIQSPKKCTEDRIADEDEPNEEVANTRKTRRRSRACRAMCRPPTRAFLEEEKDGLPEVLREEMMQMMEREPDAKGTAVDDEYMVPWDFCRQPLPLQDSPWLACQRQPKPHSTRRMRSRDS